MAAPSLDSMPFLLPMPIGLRRLPPRGAERFTPLTGRATVAQQHIRLAQLVDDVLGALSFSRRASALLPSAALSL